MKKLLRDVSRRSRVLKALRAGGTATCFKSNLSDPRVIEIAGLCGVDSVWLCNEHVPSTWLMIENQIRAAKLYDVDTFVRVEKGSYSDYVKPFEADATGIIVPHVTTAEEARQIVRWTRFQPVGSRAMDGGNADGKFCTLAVKDYITNNLRERIIVMQIESPAALENLEEILAVPGYDMVCFGPADFAHLSGRLGETNSSEVVAARRRVARLARAAGKYVMASGGSATRATLEREGHSLFTVGADVVGLANYVTTRLDDFSAAAPRSRPNRRKK
jgi:4-hydroxy-2-oxoheptanedioate aldolase